MNTIFEKITNTYKLKLAEFDESHDILFQIIKNNLNDEEKKFYDKIKNKKRKKEWLGTRILLKDILGLHKKIFYDEKGKPYLNEKLHISITHSNKYIGIIISKNKIVGVDLELISNRILKTAHKFISVENLSEINGKNYLQKIYLHWCAKETLFKIKGGGGYNFINDFIVKPFKLANSGTLETQILKNKAESITLCFQFINQSENQLLLVWSG